MAEINSRNQDEREQKKLKALIKEAQETENKDELKKLVSQIEAFRGKNIYDELASEIKKIKEKLFNKDPEGYQKNNRETVGDDLNKNNIKKDDLSAEGQKALDNLNSGKKLSQTEIDKNTEKVSEEVGEIKATRKVDKLLTDLKNAPDEKTRNIIIMQIRSIYSKIKTDKFLQKACKKREAEIRDILGIKNDNQQSAIPKLPLLIVSSLFIVSIGAIVLMVKKSRIKQKK
jgi:hypothetical protein